MTPQTGAPKVRKAVIPAAGLGTRFLPATKAQPKEMLPVVDTPAIQYVVEEAVAAGIDDILIITGRNKRAIEDHFDRNVELELELETRASTTSWPTSAAWPTSPTSTTSARASPSASATPCRWPASTSATNRSACCSATTSWIAPDLLRSMIDAHERLQRSVVALMEVPSADDLALRVRRRLARPGRGAGAGRGPRREAGRLARRRRTWR